MKEAEEFIFTEEELGRIEKSILSGFIKGIAGLSREEREKFIINNAPREKTE